MAAVAELLPNANGNIHETAQQINLPAEGLRINVPIPNFHFPAIVGPFSYFDARASLSELSLKESRELVTLAVVGTYLQIIAAAARIQTAKAQMAYLDIFWILGASAVAIIFVFFAKKTTPGQAAMGH